MAKYGVKLYGSGFKYGQTSTISVYYSSKIVAWAYDYNTTVVSWANIIPDPSDPAPTYWKLVKSYVGTLDDPADGITIAGGPYSSFSTSYTDIDTQTSDIEVSYSIWLFNGSRWIFCGDSYTILVSNKNSLANITSWLPKAWINSVSGTGDALGQPENNSLVTTLGVLSFMYDKFRSEASLLGNAWSPIYTPSAILDWKGPSFGVFYEDALGDAYNRSLSNTANLINSYKGTSLALQIYTTALTHLGANISVGNNLLLNYNDSSFEESLGQWTASSGTFIATTYAAAAVTPPSTAFTDPLYTPRVIGLAKLTTAATTPVTLSQNTSAVNLYGVPVTAGVNYVFSGWTRHLTNAGTVSALIKWYDRNNNYLSSTSAGTSVTTTTSWQEFTSASTSGRNGISAPSRAAFASVQITVTPSSSSSSGFLFDFFQLSVAKNSFEYQDARRVLIALDGQEKNYLANPDFEYGFSSWAAYNGTLSTDSLTLTPFVSSARTARLKSTANGNVAYVSDWVSISPGTVVTFSGYVMGSAARTAVARIEFSSQASLDAQSKILSDADGSYYPTTPYYADGTSVTLSTSAKTLVSVSAITPPYSTETGTPLAKVSIYFTDNVASDSYWLDGALLQESSVVNPYFNGNGGAFPANPVTTTYFAPADCKWETKNIYNYVSNPSFETNTTDWSASSGTLTRVSTDAGMGPLYGTQFGKLAYTTSGAVSVTAYLPTAAIGGEDIMCSVFVRGANATYTSGTSTLVVPSTEVANWSRVTNVQQLTAGQTTVTFTINVTNNSGSTSTYCHLDGAQVEYGRIASAFVDTASATAIPNPLTSGKTIYAVQTQSVGGGSSHYFYNHNVKKARLKATIGRYTPAGSTWAITSGIPLDDYKDVPSSLIPASSFEKDLTGWVANNSTLTRLVAAGSIIGDNATHGQAYAKVTTAGSSSSKPFGISTGNIYMTPSGGYYASVAIRPVNAHSTGNYTLTVNFYTASGTAIPVYTDNITGLYTTSSIDSTGASNTLSTTAARNKTVAITHTDRWAYLANTFIQSSILGAAYAVLTVTFSPTTYYSDQAFHIDRAVFRQ